MDRVRPIRESRGQSRPNPFRLCRCASPVSNSRSLCRYEGSSDLHISRHFNSFGICTYAAARANLFGMYTYAIRGEGARYSFSKASVRLFLLSSPLLLRAPHISASSVLIRNPSSPAIVAPPAGGDPDSFGTSHHSEGSGPVTIHCHVFSITYTLNFSQPLFTQAITHSRERGYPNFQPMSFQLLTNRVIAGVPVPMPVAAASFTKAVSKSGMTAGGSGEVEYVVAGSISALPLKETIMANAASRHARARVRG
jgi:hypothetical protein